jgi:DNA-binding transcriptional LysR family regulator
MATLGSFRRAAEVLHLTQPAVSKQIHALEFALDIRLLERGRTVRPTLAGEVFLKYADEITRLVRAAREELGDFQTQGRGHLAIGASPSLATAERGLDRRLAVEVMGLEMLKRPVQLGLGVSLIPQSLVAEGIKNRTLKTFTIQGLQVQSRSCLVYRQDKYILRAMQGCLDLVREASGHEISEINRRKTQFFENVVKLRFGRGVVARKEDDAPSAAFTRISVT